MKNTIRKSIIQSAINNLKEFGYPDVNSENILTDEVYSRFFASMLKENLGRKADAEINELLAEIEQNTSK